MSTVGEGRRALRNAVAVSVVSGAVAAFALAVLGRPRAGLALAAGLLIGSVNGYFVARSLGAGVPLHAGSLARLGVLTAAGLAAGFALGTDVAWLALAGLAGSQLALAGASFKEALAQR